MLLRNIEKFQFLAITCLVIGTHTGRRFKGIQADWKIFRSLLPAGHRDDDQWEERLAGPGGYVSGIPIPPLPLKGNGEACLTITTGHPILGSRQRVGYAAEEEESPLHQRHHTTETILSTQEKQFGLETKFLTGFYSFSYYMILVKHRGKEYGLSDYRRNNY